MEACGTVVVILACAVNDEGGEDRSEDNKGVEVATGDGSCI